MKKSIKVIVTFLALICISFLILGASAIDIVNENSNTVMTNNDLLLFSSSFSEDFTFSADGSSIMLLSDDDNFYLSWEIATEKIYSTAGNEIMMPRKCTHDYTPEQAVKQREEYMNEHNGNIWEENTNDGLPTGNYNCHTYAWYGFPDDEEYWLIYIDAFIDDVHCQPLSDKSELQEGDIIVFWDDDVATHSAKVYSIRYEAGNSEPIIELQSKLGQQGVYIHSFEYTETLYTYDDESFYRYTQGEHDWEIIENNGEDGVTLGCKAARKIDGVDTYCTHTMECDHLVYYQGTDSSGHYASCENGCFNLFEEHDYYVDTTLDSGHMLRCRWCNYSKYDDHEYYIYDKSEEYHCILKCTVCEHTYNCFHELSYTNVGSSGHTVSCTLYCFNIFELHDLYMYSAETEDYTVKCRDCNYSVRCVESPEYYGDSDDGHWVDCPDGCYSFYEPHTPDSYDDIGESSHEVVCADCGYTYYEDHNYGDCYHTASANYHYYECVDCGYTYAEAHTLRRVTSGDLYTHIVECTVCDYDSTESHTWVSYGTGYRCSVCKMLSDSPPIIMSLPDPELEAYLASLSVEEREEFIASLPEDQVDRVTALLPSDDEHLTE